MTFHINYHGVASSGDCNWGGRATASLYFLARAKKFDHHQPGKSQLKEKRAARSLGQVLIIAT
jgi:hypothetical protein